MAANVWKDQFIASGVDGFNVWKSSNIAKQLDSIVKEAMEENKQQDIHFENALSHMLKMRQFLADPTRILGPVRTKHGEVAEQLEVHVRNAWAALKGQSDVATFDGVGRTAPEDFILNGIKYQSKFINGTNNTLKHVLDHIGKYQDGSMNYSIPKDQYEIIQAIREGNYPPGLNNKSIQAILKKVGEIELQSGRRFEDFVKSSLSDYSDVQLGKVGESVTNHQDQLIDENQRIKNQIKKKAEDKTKSVESKRGPSVGEGVKVAGTAALVTGTLQAFTSIYSKIKSGKNLADFHSEDWKEVGLTSAKAGVKGGITAGSIYALTNLTSLSAPFAAAVTSATIGLTVLVKDLNNNTINMDEFVTQGQVLCIEAGIAAIGGAMGQMLIPVPVIGSIIGTVTANVVWGFAKGKLGAREEDLKRTLNAYTDSILMKVDSVYRDIIGKINETYAHFNSLIDAAFDIHANSAVLAAASVKLAEGLGVDESKILRDDKDLEAFFLG
jgi:hypothetical protein